MASLELTDDEAVFVNDILQMYMEGIEAEIPQLSTETDELAHWSLFRLRRQFETAGRIRLRINMMRGTLV